MAMNQEDAIYCFEGLDDVTADLGISVGQAMTSGVFKHGQPGKEDLQVEFALSGDHEDFKKATDELYAGMAQYMSRTEYSNAIFSVCVKLRFPE